MKKMMQMAALALMVVLGSSFRNSIAAQPYNDYDQDRDVSYQTFYDELSPYGRWVEYPGQGYVWVPDAGDDFRPYSTNGHWVWTENYEWMWVSDYDWGWAPFHYGRWDYDPYYGWYWVPGYEWSPAWVAWRDGGDYYGWAPIRPGIHISINFNIGGYNPPYDFWVFAPRRYITSPRIYDYYVDRRRNVTIINQTTIIINNFNYSNNYGFRSGPRRYDAEVYCGRINPVRFRQSATPGRTFYRNNEVSVYRPTIQRNSNRNVAPRNFERYDRNNGSFRNNNNGNNTGFRREDNNRVRDNNVANNRRPDSRDRVNNNGTFRRNDNNTGRTDDNNLRREDNRRQPSRDINNRPNNPGRIDRNDNNVPGNQPGERRLERPQAKPDRTPDPAVRQPDNNRFERRQNDNPVNAPGRNRDVRTDDNRFQRQPQQIERRQEPRQQPQQIERRQEPRQQPQQIERRQEPRQQPQRVERRQEPRQQPQQIERRQESRQQPQQFERRDAGANRQERSANNNGGGNGKGRGRN